MRIIDKGAKKKKREKSKSEKNNDKKIIKFQSIGINRVNRISHLNEQLDQRKLVSAIFSIHASFPVVFHQK